MAKEIKLYSHHSGEPNFFDRVLEKTVLRFFPQSVTPNQVTIFRYVCIPLILLFLIIGENAWGMILFAIAALSDAVDGALARTRDKITDWGKIHDPFADKLLIISVGIIVISIYLNYYIIAAIILIEFLLILNAYFKMKKKFKIMSALWPGKIKMVLQSFGIVSILLFIIFPFSWLLIFASVLLYGAIFFGLVSLVIYGSI